MARVTVLSVFLVAFALSPLSIAAQDDLSPEESDYFGRVSVIGSVIGDTSSDISTLMNEGAVADLRWQNDMIGEAAVLDAMREVLQGIEPPSRSEDSHADLLAALDSADAAGAQLRLAVESLDEAAIAAAVQATDEANASVQRAIDAARADLGQQVSDAGAEDQQEAELEPEATSPPAVGTTEDNPAPVGTRVENGGVAVTLTSAYFTDAYGYSTPKGGYTFLVIEATIEAIEDGHSYNEGQFRAFDVSTDAEFSNAFVLADGMLGNGELSPGEFVSGTVVLEVQQGATALRIKYDPAMFDPNDLYWLVG